MVERVPVKLLIADRNLAMVQVDVEGRAPAALIVHRSGLLDALLVPFTSVWERARPLRITHDSLTEQDTTARSTIRTGRTWHCC